MGQQVTHILQQAFQEMDIELFEMSRGRLLGTVICAVFKKGLGAQVQKVSILLAYAPRKMMLMKAA